MIYELRVYTVLPGRMPNMLARFRDHTAGFFEKHGIKNVGYWTMGLGGNTDELWYMLAHENLAAREKNWAAFVADQDRAKVFAESEKDGLIVHHTRAMILNPTDFSPLK
jgi:hypothetical protein